MFSVYMARSDGGESNSLFGSKVVTASEGGREAEGDVRNIMLL